MLPYAPVVVGFISLAGTLTQLVESVEPSPKNGNAVSVREIRSSLSLEELRERRKRLHAPFPIPP
jgi:hypothetical protein